MQRKFQTAFHIPGTLAADLGVLVPIPSPCQLVHLAAVASNDSDALLEVGTVADPNAYLLSGVIGDSSVPVNKSQADFVGGEFPRLAAGDVLKLTLDHDGAVGTAAQNVTLLCTLVEG